MIFGTGLDIIAIDRIKKSLAKYSPRFENKIFTDGEINYCQLQADPGKHFAARFAVKEAVSKVWEPVSIMKSALKILKSSTRLQVNPSSR